MKKLFTLVVLALATLTINAQSDKKFTVKVGLGSSSMVGSDSKAYDAAFAFKVGVTYDWALTENFYIIPGLELADKAVKNDPFFKGRVDRFYLQVPISAAYKFNLSDNTKLTLKAGPYLAYGIDGTTADKYILDAHFHYDIFSDDFCRRFDAGVLVGAQVELSRFVLGAEYSRGLTKQNSDFSAYNQAWGVVLGYKF